MPFKSRLPDVEPDSRYRGLVSNFFWDQLDKFSGRTLLVDYVSGRQWTGAQIKEASSRLALNIIELAKFGADQDSVFFYKNCDHIHLAALGVLFAGGSVCAGAPEDPEDEHMHMLMSMRPSLVFVEHRLLEEMVQLRQRSAGQLRFRIVLMDDDQLSEAQFAQLAERDAQQNQEELAPVPPGADHCPGPGLLLLGFKRHLLDREASCPSRAAEAPTPQQQKQLPVQVSPERPAFVLLTSGSTGRPKPVGRSQRNSLYVCHSFNGAESLWLLGESSVIAGHLQLDHGTGIFCLKMTIAKGLKLIVMHGYEYSMFLDAITRHSITHAVLGSALLHNFISTALEQPAGCSSALASLRNFIAVGSPIASHELVDKFMERFKECSVRQAFGATETGFICVVERDPANQDTKTVGCLLPNVIVKLVERCMGQQQQQHQEVEITEFGREGELLVSGPTVSAGYLGAQYSEQSRLAFLADGYYRTNDICSIDSNSRLKVRGRFTEVLCLHDGWKVLPAEIEQLILMHPMVKEAVVIGVPHPDLPTCHAPRAYIVPKEGVEAELEPFTAPEAQETGQAAQRSGAVLNGQQATKGHLTKESVFEFVAQRASEPKHLVGGIRFLGELPRISIGKYNKKLLRQLDGY